MAHKGVQAQPKVTDAATDAPTSKVLVEVATQTLPPATADSSCQWEQADDPTQEEPSVDDDLPPESPQQQNDQVESFDDKENDPDYSPPTTPPRTPKNSAGKPSPQTTVDDEKFLVFASELMKLFNFCQQCGAPTKPSNVTFKCIGSTLKVRLRCAQGCIWTWSSQPFLNGTGAGNVLLSATILLLGSTYERFSEMARVLHLNIMEKTSFYALQTQLLFPAIHSRFTLEKEALIAAFGQDPIILSGDARCDSPGFSAKYSTYSLMESESGVLVTFRLNQVQSDFVFNASIY